MFDVANDIQISNLQHLHKTFQHKFNLRVTRTTIIQCEYECKLCKLYASYTKANFYTTRAVL